MLARESCLGPVEAQAKALAKARRERLTSAHLLAAMAERQGIAAELLSERGFTQESLLRAARVSTDDDTAPVVTAVRRANEVARSMRAPKAQEIHLLVALVSMPQCAAYRALDQCGIDVARLRVLAMNAGLGQLGRRRIVTRRVGLQQQRAEQSKAVTVPLTPTLRAAAIDPEVKVGVQSTTRKSTRPARTIDKKAQPKAPQSTSRKTGVAPRPTRNRSVSTAALGRAQSAKRRATYVLNPRRYKTLANLGRNLSLACLDGNLPNVHERPKHIEGLLDVLAKHEGNNPCLVGRAGVGKTSIVYGLVQRIVHASAPLALDDRIVLEVPVVELLAGTGVRGALAERFAEIKKEVALSKGRIVLFFDDAHLLFGTDASDELSSELKRSLAAGELPCIGTMLPSEYARIVESDPALCRRFSRVEVDEPSVQETQEIISGLVTRFEDHHQVTYAPSALQAAAKWSARFITGRALPDKAISVVDFAGARARRRSLSEVGDEQVATVVSELAGVPVERLLESDAARLLELEATLCARVVGHDAKLRSVSQIIRRNAAGLGQDRPIGTFLLLGPTGVGKTETAKAIAECLFGSDLAMTRLDLSEYSEAHAVARLIGAPPGYVGHEAGGQLTESVRKRPYQVLLLDEIEKAHPEVLLTFLPLFDEGRLTDGRGRTVDFTNTVIILTSNIGAREAAGGGERQLGFGRSTDSKSDTTDGSGGNAREQRVRALARERLSPELYNRLDEVLVFAPLGREEIVQIAKRLLQKLVDTIYDKRSVGLRIEPHVIDWLIERGGFDPTLGARPMKRAIARLIEAPLAEELLSGNFTKEQEIRLSVVGGALVIEPQAMEYEAAGAAE